MKPEQAATPRPCNVRVYHGHGFRGCTRKGVIECDDKWYCKQHDPVARAQKANDRDAAWRAKWAREREQRERTARAVNAHDAAVRLAAGILEKPWSQFSMDDFHALKEMARAFQAAAK